MKGEVVGAIEQWPGFFWSCFLPKKTGAVSLSVLETTAIIGILGSWDLAFNFDASTAIIGSTQDIANAYFICDLIKVLEEATQPAAINMIEQVPLYNSKHSQFSGI